MRENYRFTNYILSVGAVFGFLLGCSPKIYVIDRQTILESEAAGRWPEFEKMILEKSKASAPTAFSTTPMNSKRAKLYNVLDGYLVEESQKQ